MPAAGRAKSCTSCRQVKLRCDANTTFPAACTRCKRNNLDCNMDPTFKRMSTRRRLEEVTSKLTTLERVLETERRTKPMPIANQEQPRLDIPVQEPRDVRRSVGLSSTLGGSSSPSSAISTSWADSLDSEPTLVETWNLADVAVPHSTVREVFRYFDRHHYRHIPILEKRSSFAALYDDNVFLFWTIFVVGSKRHSKHCDLYKELIPHYRAMLGTILVKAIRSISTIHSLLILCLWPGMAARDSDDPSWHYCGLAVNSAMQMSLHRPRSVQHSDNFGVSATTERCRAMTWMACFQISTSLSSLFGLPPQISSPSQLDYLTSLYYVPDIPKSFTALTEIQRQVTRYSTAMEEVKEPRLQQSLITHFDRDLDGVRERFQDAWSPEAEYNLQCAKAYLYALCFLGGEISPLNQNYVDPTTSPDAFRVLLLSGLGAAVRMIHILSEIGDSPAGSSPEDSESHGAFLIYYPKMYLGHIFFAAMYLLKYPAMDPHATESDRVLARNHVTAAYQILVRYTKSRERSRVAQVLQVFSRIAELGGVDARMHVRDRFGASICYSAFWEVERMRNRGPEHLPQGQGAKDVAAATGMLPGPPEDSKQAENFADPVFQQLMDGLWDDVLDDNLQLGGRFDDCWVTY